MALQSGRAVALAALHQWRCGIRFADAIIQQLHADGVHSPPDRGFATELFYGVLRNLTLLDFYIGRLRSDSLDHDSRDLLRLGLYQLLCLRTPSHAAVNETVALARRKSRPLINGVLRNAVREIAELEKAAAAESLATRFSHPQFLVERWRNHLGESATAALCAWNNKPATVYARVNQLKITRDEFLGAHPTAEPLAEWPNFVRLREIPHDALARGECYIQDPSTSVACQLLDPQPGETILDACAAPGGKSSLLAELMQNRGELVACDRAPARLAILRQNLARLGVSCARPLVHDWDGSASPELSVAGFDRILVDAPCSNTGVLRRRVDARWRLRPEDFERMPGKQLSILRAVRPLLKPGGTLVYSTCSIERDENEKVVAELMREFSGLKLMREAVVLPFRDGFDGAYAARLLRTV